MADEERTGDLTVTIEAQLRQCWTCKAPMMVPLPSDWTFSFRRMNSITTITPHRPDCSGDLAPGG